MIKYFNTQRFDSFHINRFESAKLKDMFFMIYLDMFKRAVEGAISEPNIGMKYKNLSENIFLNEYLEIQSKRPEFNEKISRLLKPSIIRNKERDNLNVVFRK